VRKLNKKMEKKIIKNLGGKLKFSREKRQTTKEKKRQ